MHQLDLPPILEQHRTFLESTMRPCNEITYTLESTLPWESKLGGCPYLEREEDYPRDKQGNPMFFLAQVNFAEMPPLEGFPQSGILQFYVADDEMYGLESPCVVRYLNDVQPDPAKLLAENPFPQENPPFAKDGKMHFAQRMMPIGTECPLFTEHFPYKTTPKEIWNALYDVCYAAGSRVGGYPHFVQHSAAYYDDGIYDILLLQLDLDEVCGIMFGDSGNCNFFLSKENLKKCDFSKTEYDWQCC